MAKTVFTPAHPWQEKLSKQEYRNWLAVGHSLSITSDGIRPFIERQMKAFQRYMAKNLGPSNSCHCTRVPGRRPTPWHNLSVCAWATELQKHHNKRSPTWKQSDSTKWTDPNLGHWEIAKLFMPDLGSQAKDVVDASTTDPTGLLNLVDWCTIFNIQRPVIKRVRDTRNAWGHAPQQELSDLERNEAFQAMRDLLGDPALTSNPDVQKALVEITALQTTDIANFEEIEMKVLKDLITSMQENVISKVNQLESQTALDAAQTRKELQEVKDLIKYYVSKEPGMKKDRSAGGDEMEIRDILEVLEPSPRSPENMSRSTTSVDYFGLKSIATLSLWIFLSTIKHKKTVLWIVWLCLLQSLQVLDDSSVNDECGIEPLGDPLELKEFNFSDYITTSNVNFTGRQWLFREMEELFEKRSSLSGILIVGDPGSGKSAFVSHLICSKVSSSLIHDRIVGYHFCTHSDKSKQNGAKFVRNMANMIAAKIPEYRDIILSDDFLRRVLHQDCPHDPVGCFDQGIVTPLRHIRIKARRPWYIVIDALDECSDGKDIGQEESIVSLLKFKIRRFPKWLKVILTSRNVTGITKNLAGVEILHLRSDDDRNSKDIGDFISKKLYTHSTLLANLVVDLDITDEEPFSKAVRLLVNKSQGNFQYIKVVLDHWFTSDETISQSEIPKSLASTYQIYFERKYGSLEHFAPVRRIFEVLVAAYKPLTAQELYSVLQTSQSDMDFEYDFIPKLMELSLFLWHGEPYEHVGIYHSSLSEWLTSEDNKGGPFYVKSKNGHKHLARYYVEMAQKGHVGSMSEDIFHLTRHVVEGDAERQAFLSLNSSLINRTDHGTRTTALHYSAGVGNSKITALLQNHFTEVDCADIYGRTPIFIAVTAGHYENTLALFERGANLHHTTKPLDAEFADHSRDPVKECKRRLCGYSLLHVASNEGRLRVLEFLLENVPHLVSGFTGAGNTAFQVAAENGHVEVLKVLSKAGARADLLSLHHAASNGHVDVVQYLLRQGVKDTCIQENITNRNCNHIKKKQKACHSTNNGNKRMETYLTDDRHVELRETALHAAVSKDKTDVVMALTKERDNAIKCFDAAGRLPLHVAVYQDKHTALDILIATGADVLATCKSVKFSPPESKVQLISSCPCGYTPLHIASLHGHYSIAELLIKQGAEVNAGDCNGSTPLHIVACHGISSFVPLLVEAGANINVRALNGSTPLHSAAACLSTRTSKLLLEEGSDAKLLDDAGMTALHYIIKDVTLANDTYFADLYVNNPIDWIESNLQEGYNEDVLQRHPWLQSLVDFIENLAVTEDEDILYTQGRNNATVFDMLEKHGLSDALTLLTGSTRANGGEVLFSATPFMYIVDQFLVSMIEQKYLTLPKRYEWIFSPKIIRKTISWSFKTFILTVDCSALIYRVRSNLIYTTNMLLEISHTDVNCQESGLSPLLVYLRTGGRHMAKVLAKHGVLVDIKCGLPIENSTFHLSAYHKLHYLHYLSVFFPDVEKWEKYLESSDDALFDYLLYEYEEARVDGTIRTVKAGDGPLARAIKSHPRSYRIIDECLDANGYTALHRAAQGANVLAIEQFLSWGANARLETPEGLSPLILAVLYAIKFRPSLNFERPSVLTSLEVEFASMSATSILSHLVLNSSVDIKCGEADLTLLHLAATRGMSKFVEHLFSEENVVRVTANCSNKHGVTPMYLAAMLGGNTCTWGSPWCGVVHVLKGHGGVLQYPSMEAEFFLIFHTLFGSFPGRFKVDLTEDEIQTLREECGRDECRDYAKSNAAEYLSLSDEFHQIFKIYRKAIGNRGQCQSSPQEREVLQRIEEAVPVLMMYSSDFNDLHVYFYNIRMRHMMFLDNVHKELVRHFQEITRPNTDIIPCGIVNTPSPEPDIIIDVCSSHGSKNVLDLNSELEDAHNAYMYDTNDLRTLSKEATSFFYKEGKALGYIHEINHALYKHDTHLRCDWQRITIKYVRLRFLLHILKFWRNAVLDVSGTPIVSEFLSSRLEKILMDPSKESIDLILQLALGNQFQEYSYLERLKFLKPPLWKNTFPNVRFPFDL